MKKKYSTIAMLIIIGLVTQIGLDVFANGTGPPFPNLPPYADAGPDQTVSPSQVVILNGSNSFGIDAFIISYKWDFNANDGINWNIPDATGIIVNTSYPNLGTYTVTLQIIDNYWETDTDTCIITVVATPPIADPNGPYAINEGESLPLDANGSYDPNGYIVTYQWDLDNDGLYDDATGNNPTIPWVTLQTLGIDDDGTYPINLKVTDNESGTDTASTSVTVTNTPPSIEGTANQTGDEGTEILFTAGTVTDPGNEIFQYRWDWENDGTWDTSFAASPTMGHTWDDNPGGEVKVEVYDGDGGYDTDICYAIVNNIPPTSPTNLDFTPVPFHTNDTLTATASNATDAPGDISTLTYWYYFYDIDNDTLIQDWSPINNIIITADLNNHVILVKSRAHDKDGANSTPYEETIGGCPCLKGDCNKNCTIDIFDFDAFAQAWGSTNYSNPYNQCCDFDNDGDVDIFDFDGFAQAWGQTYCDCSPCTAPPWQEWT